MVGVRSGLEWGRGSPLTRDCAVALIQSLIHFPARADSPTELKAHPSTCVTRRRCGMRMEEPVAHPSPRGTLRCQQARSLTCHG